MRIAVVAPSSRFKDDAELDDVIGRITAIARADHPGVEVRFHPQCRLRAGHFAGSDERRLAALVEVADDPGVDAVWFARGGYGSNRIAERAIAAMGPAARGKAWLGYSDAGFLLAGLYRAGFESVAHGPMPRDVLTGDEPIRRALAWLAERSPDALEPRLEPGRRYAAFNITVLGMLLGSPLEPDLAGHELLLEDISEYLYATDRALFHITAQPSIRRAAGIRLGRIAPKPNPGQPFGEQAPEIVERWCRDSGIPFLGEADIGHDSGNRIVPFGPLRTQPSTGIARP